jgi:integrase
MAEAGYGASAVGGVRTYIKACFEYAAGQKSRKIRLASLSCRTCERFLTVDELRAILAVCGLRPAEVLVLRIEDFEGAQLRIDEALKERQKGQERIGTTKTAESDNYVPVPPDLAPEIEVWIAGHPIAMFLALSCSLDQLERHLALEII